MRILPPNSLLQRRSGLNLFALAGCALTLSSCAKFPAGGGGQNTHLRFHMEVAGHIKNGPTELVNYIYMVAINPSTDPSPITQGPVPVIAFPWGNGFVAGNATHFIRYDFAQASPYSIWRFATPDLLAYGNTGSPVIVVPVAENGNTIEFEVDMSQILPNGVTDPSTLQSIQVNFLTMDRAPRDNDPGPKIWDALGDARNPSTISFWVNIPLNVSRRYQNSDLSGFEQEPSGDVSPNDPDLDIVNWWVDVIRP